ncbi:hypothetical protein R3P38DRAFT_2804411 [Favolaschia claudopus]|uniref:Uncharacterized protein n=1 Tax=Favolaschia claudopus TaxID=2862362 RepID=A0AAV9ZRA5_9AGAR
MRRYRATGNQLHPKFHKPHRDGHNKATVTDGSREKLWSRESRPSRGADCSKARRVFHSEIVSVRRLQFSPAFPGFRVADGLSTSIILSPPILDSWWEACSRNESPAKTEILQCLGLCGVYDTRKFALDVVANLILSEVINCRFLSRGWSLDAFWAGTIGIAADWQTIVESRPQKGSQTWGMRSPTDFASRDAEVPDTFRRRHSFTELQLCGSIHETAIALIEFKWGAGACRVAVNESCPPPWFVPFVLSLSYFGFNNGLRRMGSMRGVRTDLR